MKALKMIPFATWMYLNLRTLSVYKKGIAKARDPEEERENILGATRTWGQNVTKKMNLNITVEGQTSLPEGPVVFASNHQGYADIVAFCVAVQNKQFGFLAKKDLFDLPVFGRWIKRVRSVFLERDDARASLKAIEQGIEYLEEGFSLVVFPEGTRSKGSEMGEFKKGSLRLATKLGLPVIPITISGTWRAYEEFGYIKPAKAHFYIHPAIETKGLDRKQASNLASVVEGIVREKVNEYEQKK